MNLLSKKNVFFPSIFYFVFFFGRPLLACEVVPFQCDWQFSYSSGFFSGRKIFLQTPQICSGFEAGLCFTADLSTFAPPDSFVEARIFLTESVF